VQHLGYYVSNYEINSDDDDDVAISVFLGIKNNRCPGICILCILHLQLITAIIWSPKMIMYNET